MRNPHGNLICPFNSGEGQFITDSKDICSGPWGVTCGFWRCSDTHCALKVEEARSFGYSAHLQQKMIALSVSDQAPDGAHLFWLGAEG